jgi:hypothetical protein
MLFILVQIQAGPPAFAAIAASARQASLPPPKPYEKAGLSRRSSQSEGGKLPVDGAPKTLSRLRNLV